MNTRECLTTASGKDYTGHQNYTLSRIPCQRWSSKSPHDHAYDDIKYFADYATDPAAIVQDVANYCRNPAVLSSADVQPWCFTTNENIRKEYCNIPRCKGKQTRRVFVLISALRSLWQMINAKAFSYIIKSVCCLVFEKVNVHSGTR